MESVIGRKAEVLPFEYRPKFEIEEMVSPVHNFCGLRNAQFVHAHGIYSYYRCNHCKTIFPVREANYTYGKSKKRING